jgi:23S rRNA pseudouridine2605 synthase
MAQERLHKIIANAGITSRRKAEQMILEGAVTVNGQLITELGAKADPKTDHIKVNGKLIMTDVEKVYVVLNKPKGVVSSLEDPEGRLTLSHLLRGVAERVVPVGRLDYSSEGMLLLTNDGDLVNKLFRAKTLPKTYNIKAKGHFAASDMDGLKEGIFTQEGVLRFNTITLDSKLDNKTWISLEVTEGASLDIREILNHRGILVDRIVRTAIGSLKMGDMEPGEFRFATAADFQKLAEEAEAAEKKPRGEGAEVVVNKRAARSEKRSSPWAERRERDERKEWQERRDENHFGDRERPARPSFGGGERRSFGDRPARPSFGGGERRPFGDRPPRREGGFGGGERRSFGDRPARPSFGDRPARPSFGGGERRPFGDRPPRREGGFGGGERRSFGDRPPRREGGFGGGERRSFGDRPPRREGGFGGERRGGFGGGERRSSFGSRGGRPSEPTVKMTGAAPKYRTWRPDRTS